MSAFLIHDVKRLSHSRLRTAVDREAIPWIFGPDVYICVRGIRIMSVLFVLGFDKPHKAEEVSLKLQELQGKYLLHLEEVIVAIKGHNGKVSCTKPAASSPRTTWSLRASVDR
jgi:hypothetical protein